MEACGESYTGLSQFRYFDPLPAPQELADRLQWKVILPRYPFQVGEQTLGAEGSWDCHGG